MHEECTPSNIAARTGVVASWLLHRHRCMKHIIVRDIIETSKCITSLVPRPINKGLVTRNRIPWFRPQKTAVTNQNRDNKNVTKRNKICAVFVALPTGNIQNTPHSAP